MVTTADLDATKMFIDYAPTSLVLSRRVRSPDGAGGWVTGDPTELSGQVVRVVGQKETAAIVSADGRTIRIDKAVVGMPDLDVEVGDTFEWDGSTYEVVSVRNQPTWSVMASAVRRGSVNPVGS